VLQAIKTTNFSNTTQDITLTRIGNLKIEPHNSSRKRTKQRNGLKMSHNLHFDRRTHSADGTLQGSMDDANESNMTTTPSSSRIALSHSPHPVACMFHCFFQKLVAHTRSLHIFGGYFCSTNKYGKNPQCRQIKFITVSVCLILLLAADVWGCQKRDGTALARGIASTMVEHQVEGESTKSMFESAPNRCRESISSLRLFLPPPVHDSCGVGMSLCDGSLEIETRMALDSGVWLHGTGWRCRRVPMSTDITTSVLPIKRRNFNK
jgi:hypothetical protein